MIAVALSGGVDSAVALARLHREGVRVVGVTARLLPPKCQVARGCCDEQKARELCAMLGIEHYIVDLSPTFGAAVMDQFLADYEAGLTPNPCLPCNALIKFGELLERVPALGCEGLATGHYAIRERRGERWGVRRGRDLAKDQSYMLMGLSQEQLAASLFPLGEALKVEVVAEAMGAGLPCAERESQDVCFVPGEVTEYLQRRLDPAPGPIVDAEGRALGEHKGQALYTIGQRRGLDVPGAERLFVIAKDPESNTVVVGPRAALEVREFAVRDLNWVSIAAPVAPLECEVVVRYRGRAIAGTVTIGDESDARIELAPHDQAIAPGQGVALYDAEGWLLGGGTIS